MTQANHKTRLRHNTAPNSSKKSWPSALGLAPLGRLGHRGPVCLAQHRNHLLVCESALSHGLLADWEPIRHDGVPAVERAPYRRPRCAAYVP